MLPTSKTGPIFKFVSCHLKCPAFWANLSAMSLLWQSLSGPQDELLRLKSLRKVGESLWGKADIIGTNYRRRVGKPIWRKGWLPTLTGRVGCSSDLDPSAHPSSPQPHVPKQATLATRANNNAFRNQENIPQQENNFSQLLPLNVGDRWELQPFIYCLKSVMLNLGVTWWIRKVWQSGNPNLCTAVE